MTVGLVIAFALGHRDPSGATFLLPLTAVQLLWINVLADGPPALALAFDRNPGLMNRPPRPPGAKLLDPASLKFIAISGFANAVGGIGILVAMPRMGYSLEEMRTSLFLYESVLQLVFAYPARRVYVAPLRNMGVHLTVGLGIVLQVLTILLPPLQALLGLVPLSLGVFASVMVLVLVAWAVAEFLGHITPVAREAAARRA